MVLHLCISWGFAGFSPVFIKPVLQWRFGKDHSKAWWLLCGWESLDFPDSFHIVVILLASPFPFPAITFSCDGNTFYQWLMSLPWYNNLCIKFSTLPASIKSFYLFSLWRHKGLFKMKLGQKSQYTYFFIRIELEEPPRSSIPNLHVQFFKKLEMPW